MCRVIPTLKITFFIPVSFPLATINPLHAELNPIGHLLALLGGATIVVVSRLRVNIYKFSGFYIISLLHNYILTLNLLTTTIVALPSNASERQMGFNSACKGLIRYSLRFFINSPFKAYWSRDAPTV